MPALAPGWDAIFDNFYNMLVPRAAISEAQHCQGATQGFTVTDNHRLPPFKQINDSVQPVDVLLWEIKLCLLERFCFYLEFKCSCKEIEPLTCRCEVAYFLLFTRIPMFSLGILGKLRAVM